MLPTKYGFKMQTDVTETQGSGSVADYMEAGASGKEKYVTSLRGYSASHLLRRLPALGVSRWVGGLLD